MCMVRNLSWWRMVLGGPHPWWSVVKLWSFEICTALAAKDKIGVEGSASGYEGGHDSLCRSSAVRWPASVIRP